MHPDVAARLAHETIDHRQPQTAAAAKGFGGIERLEDMGNLLGGDAAARVGDLETHALPRVVRRVRADANREGPAPLEHGIARVQGEVEERALELMRVGIGVERRLGQVEHDGDGLAQRAFEDHAHGAHQFAHLDRLRREGLRTREGEQPPDEGHAARARRQRRFEIFAHGA